MTAPAFTAVVAAGALIVSAAPAQAAVPYPKPPPTVIADGLDNPRGLTFAPDGTLYVAEAGQGGAGPCQDRRPRA